MKHEEGRSESQEQQQEGDEMHIRSKIVAAALAATYLCAIGATGSAAATSKSVSSRTTLTGQSGLHVEQQVSRLKGNPNAGNPPGTRAPTQTWKDPKGNPNAGNPPGTRAPTQTWKDPKGNPNAGNPPGTRAPTQTFGRHHVR
jgi:hypothetical protein